MSKKLTGNLMLLVTALIWGTAFVAQSAGMAYVGPFTYNGVRTLVGGLVLLPLLAVQSRRERGRRDPEEKRRSLTGGVFCGVLLCVASSFQQYGISMTTAGKAGFITALYIVIVPLMGIFMKKKIPGIIWMCVGTAVLGFYLLCVKEGFSISHGDLLVLCCAFFFSLHIMVIDHFAAGGVDGLLMSCVQFLVAGALTMIPAILFEDITWAGLWSGKLTILYTGVMSCGVGYTLQILGQKRTDPTMATLLLSLESVFAALFGWLLLHEQLSGRELVGCALVFLAVLLAQIPLPRGAKETVPDRTPPADPGKNNLTL